MERHEIYIELELGRSIAGVQRQVVVDALQQFAYWLEGGYLGAGVELEVYVGPARTDKATRELFAKADAILEEGR